MIAGALLLAAVTVAFPEAGRRLPALDRVYVIGAASRGITNVTVAGERVDLYRTGAWATVVPLVPGTNNVIPIVWQGAESGETNLTVKVAAKPAPSAAPAAKPAPPRKWTKLPYAADAPQPPPFGKPAAEITLVLDPGHGGTDTGALSPHAFPEKNANLLTAREVKKALEAHGYCVVLTREKDIAVPLYERPKIAHEQKADAFVSIHHNAPPLDRDPRRTRYAAVYAWNGIGKGLAAAISAALDDALEGEMPNKGVLEGNLAVTRNPQIPSCLVEVDFVTSPAGEAAIWNVKRRRYLAEAIARGIDAWCKPRTDPPPAEGAAAEESPRP